MHFVNIFTCSWRRREEALLGRRAMSLIGSFRTSRDVRLESGMRIKADDRQRCRSMSPQGAGSDKLRPEADTLEDFLFIVEKDDQGCFFS
jgi:hypothetical protein